MCIDHKRLCSVVTAVWMMSAPGMVRADSSVTSTTYLRVEQESHPGVPTRTLAPVTEFLSLDQDKLGDGHLSAHLYGWGRVDLADSRATVDGRERSIDGSLTYGYLQYRFDHANAQARGGRLFVYEGIVNEQIDGVSARTDLPYGFGVSAFGGATVHTVKIPGADTDGKGDGIFGGRVNYRKGGLLDIGFSGLYETKAPALATQFGIPGSYGDHRLIGGDIWLRPLSIVQISGHTSYNTETEHVAEHSYLLQVTPIKDLVVSGTFDEHHDRDYFYSSVLFSEMLRNLGQESKVYGGSASYALPMNLELSADYRHYSRDIGEADRFGGELRGNFLSNSVRSGLDYHYLRAGSGFAIVPVAGASGSYHEARGWAMRDTKTYTAAVDLIGYFFDKPVEGKDSAWEGICSLGYHLTPALALSGDLSFGQNPQYDNELRGLLRLTYNTSFTGLTGKGDAK
jgi:hypothetical protein